MKKKIISMLVVTIISTLIISSSAFAAESNYGSKGAGASQSFTLEQMLKYAIQDEYLAKAEYEEIIDTFGAQNPFNNIIRSEKQHISLLIPLFESYGIPMIEDTSADHIMIPESIETAMKVGVEAEVNNIAMYEAFLKQDIPDDVRDVFTRLKNASENHLKAFENGVGRLDGSKAYGNGSKGGRSNNRGNWIR